MPNNSPDFLMNHLYPDCVCSYCQKWKEVLQAELQRLTIERDTEILRARKAEGDCKELEKTIQAWEMIHHKDCLEAKKSYEADRQELLKEIESLKNPTVFLGNSLETSLMAKNSELKKELDWWKSTAESHLKEISSIQSTITKLESEAKMGNIPYKEAMRLKETNKELLSGIKVGVDVIKCVREGYIGNPTKTNLEIREMTANAITTLNKLVEKYK